MTESLDETYPLYEVIPENQLGLDHVSGRPKIAKEVLEGIRMYLMVAYGPEKIAREERLRKYLEELENDLTGQKTILRLEPFTKVTNKLDKGKGIVYEFSTQMETNPRPEKLMASAISVGAKVLQSWKVVSEIPDMNAEAGSTQSGFLLEGPTGYIAGSFEYSVYGTSMTKPKDRKIPGTFKRRANGKGILKEDTWSGKKIGERVVMETKRKAQEDVEPSKNSARFKRPLVVSSEGPSSI